MAALAAQSDVEAVLGRSLTSDEEERVSALLDLATAVARQRTRRQFEAGDYTVTRIVRRGRIQLPEAGTVTEIRDIASDGDTTVIDSDYYTVRGSTVYGLDSYCEVEVDFTTTGDAPAQIVAAVAQMVADVFSGPATGVQSETVGPFTVRYASSAGTVTAGPSQAAIFAQFAAAPLGPVLL